ncbi:MAG: hypothetical protein AB7O96_06960 [Pseudobdellovibrionaceae bacterium]
MHETSPTFRELKPSARWIYIGNLIGLIGFLATTIGQLQKAVESSTVEPFNPNYKPNSPDRSAPSARDYFS